MAVGVEAMALVIGVDLMVIGCRKGWSGGDVIGYRSGGDVIGCRRGGDIIGWEGVGVEVMALGCRRGWSELCLT